MAIAPFPYSHLSFFSFDIFAPKDPSLSGWVDEPDFNCARSTPNALIGSRSRDDHPASISVIDATSMAEAGLEPYFSLRKFSIKPMNAPPGGVTIKLLGYTGNQNAPLSWHVDFPYGYHLPFLVKLQDYSKEIWEQLQRVEITADFGPAALDYEFCMDDLEIQFTKSSSFTSEYSATTSQRTLQYQ